mmetsp:Transcript_18701/g.20884  ORF Transcript_18701/g.20884 Transcript_18701/m.20884 type:complete len:204 (+) Transcript_18701:123-734(+)
MKKNPNDKKVNCLPPMSSMTSMKRSIQSMDRIMTGDSTSSNGDCKLPYISKPRVTPERKNFGLSVSRANSREKESSLLRNSQRDNPFQPMTPNRSKLQKFKLSNIKPISKFKTEKKMKTHNSQGRLLNNQENIHGNIKSQAQNLPDGFNATFSKHGSISGAEAPQIFHGHSEFKFNPEIEVKPLEEYSDEGTDLDRSETELSN